MIHGAFDFFFATTGGNGAEGACGWTMGPEGATTGGATGPVVAPSTGGAGGGGGGAGGGTEAGACGPVGLL